MTAGDAAGTSGDLLRGQTPLAPRTIAWLVALLGWTTFICFYDLSGGAFFEPIDCWVAQTAREMLDAEDWLVPRFSGETRMQKSPGPYWAVMGVSLLRNGVVDEVSARIPNALAAILLVATVFWLTRRIAGDRPAIFAGFATASSVLVIWWSHRAASDLGLTTFTTISLAALWVAVNDEPAGLKRNLLFLLGYFAAGLGMLYKMPMPLAVVGVPAVLYVVLRWKWRIFAHWIHLPGLLLFLLPWLPWALAVMQVEDTALAKWRVEFVDRYTGRMPNVKGQGGWESLAFYLPVPLLYCLPFSLSLPTALWRGGKRWVGINRDGTLFMLIWFVGLLVFFTSSTGKEERYFLPALPPLFVLLGIELAAFFDPTRITNPRLDKLGPVLVWILTPAVLIGVALWVLPLWWDLRGSLELAGLYELGDVLRAYAVLAAIIALGCCLSAWLYIKPDRRTTSFAVLVCMMWVAWLWAWPKVMPLVLSQRPYRDFAAQLSDPQRLPPSKRDALHMLGSQDPRVNWYSDIPVPRLIDQLELLAEQEERYNAGLQDSRRDLEYELQRYGEEIIDGLRGDELVLYMATVIDYLKFINVAPERLAEAGEPLPPVHLWMQSRYGEVDDQMVLFGNKPPLFPQVELQLTPRARNMLAKQNGRSQWPTTMPATQPAEDQADQDPPEEP